MKSSNLKKSILRAGFVALALSWTAISQAQTPGMGFLEVRGEPGKYQIFQKVKAVRCSLEKRGQCDPAVFFDLNKTQTLTPGHYILGFENSLYPDLVEIRDGQQVKLQLEKLSIPSSVKGQKIRIYRDFTSLTEQKKMYLSMYFMNRHFFRLEKENFGDLYLTGAWERDFVQRFTYEACPVIKAYGTKETRAISVCSAWNLATSPMDLRDLFEFHTDGTLTEMWVTFPGDVFPSKHARYLVSAPMGEQDFVAVFPGQYRVQADGKGQRAVSVRAGNSAGVLKWENLLNARAPEFTLGAECFKTKVWKTNERAYCTSDAQEGCHRLNVRFCEPMQ